MLSIGNGKLTGASDWKYMSSTQLETIVKKSTQRTTALTINAQRRVKPLGLILDELWGDETLLLKQIHHCSNTRKVRNSSIYPK